jgi:hypothetical protein
VSWSRRFDVAVVLSDGKRLETLHDARRYLLSLPKSRHEHSDVTNAIEALLMAAERRGPLTHANAGIARVVYGPLKIPKPKASKGNRWGRPRPARDR